MKNIIMAITSTLILASLAGCAGMKAVNPNDKNKNEGTMAIDWSGGAPKMTSTYTCKLESTGNHFEAVKPTEDEARAEVVAKCRDHAMLSFCKAEKAVCVKN